MDKDIEMVDLLGNNDAEDVRLEKERGAGYHDKTDHSLASARGITFRFRRNWHSFLLIFVVLMGTMTFFINQIHFSHNGSGATIGMDEDKTNQKTSWMTSLRNKRATVSMILSFNLKAIRKKIVIGHQKIMRKYVTKNTSQMY